MQRIENGPSAAAMAELKVNTVTLDVVMVPPTAATTAGLTALTAQPGEDEKPDNANA